MSKIEEHYDVIVCGAGPAGLVAAYDLASKAPQLSIALLDRRDPWREPVACAEAVHKGGLHSLVDVSESWVRSVVDGVVFVSPDGTRVKYTQKDSGYIIDRSLMHRTLAERCQEEGVFCDFRTRVLKVHPFLDGKRQIDLKHNEEDISITARFVVDACGAGSKILQESNIVPGRFDVEPAVFTLATGVEFDPKYIELYFSSEYAPGGYGWVFPRDEEVSNVGLCVGRPYIKEHAPRKMFQKFVDEFCPNGEFGSLHGGPIACGQDKMPLAHDFAFKAGDSADMVNPISRAGILEGMYGGAFTAQAILKLLDNPSKAEELQVYADYYEDWMKERGKSHLGLAKAKWPFAEIPNHRLDRAAHKLSKIPQEKLTLPKIFWVTLTTNPTLLWKMRSLML